MPRRDGFDWDDAELQAGLNEFNKRVSRAILAACERNGPLAEGWMRTNAPWIDRTGNARNGLRVTSRVVKRGVRMTFSHSQSYGIFLETRWNARYAVIAPAIEHWFPKTQILIFKLLED